MTTACSASSHSAQTAPRSYTSATLAWFSERCFIATGQSLRTSLCARVLDGGTESPPIGSKLRDGRRQPTLAFLRQHQVIDAAVLRRDLAAKQADLLGAADELSDAAGRELKGFGELADGHAAGAVVAPASDREHEVVALGSEPVPADDLL